MAGRGYQRFVVEAITRFLTAVAPPAQVVATIRAAQDGAEAGQQLRSRYGMSEQQSEGVLNLSLRRLTSLEARKLQDEADTLNARCGRLRMQITHWLRSLCVFASKKQMCRAAFGHLGKCAQTMRLRDHGRVATSCGLLQARRHRATSAKCANSCQPAC